MCVICFVGLGDGPLDKQFTSCKCTSHKHYPTSKRGETHYLHLLLKSDLKAFFLLNSDVPVQPNVTWCF